jgi:hypothetical protein
LIDVQAKWNVGAVGLTPMKVMGSFFRNLIDKIGNEYIRSFAPLPVLIMGHQD